MFLPSVYIMTGLQMCTLKLRRCLASELRKQLLHGNFHILPPCMQYYYQVLVTHKITILGNTCQMCTRIITEGCTDHHVVSILKMSIFLIYQIEKNVLYFTEILIARWTEFFRFMNLTFTMHNYQHNILYNTAWV